MNDKKCPVDRGKLLIGLEFCRSVDPCCRECPYRNCRCEELSEDALAYIGWLEDLLVEVFTPAMQRAIQEIFDVAARIPDCDEDMLRYLEEAMGNAGNDHEGRQDPDDA